VASFLHGLQINLKNHQLISMDTAIKTSQNQVKSNFHFMALLQKRRLTLGFVGALTLLLLANIAIFHSFSQSKIATTWVEHTYNVLLRLENITSKTHEHKHSYKHTEHHANHKNLVAISHDMRHKLYAELDEIRQLNADRPEQQQRLKALQPILAKRFEVSDNLDRIRHEQGVDSEQALAIGAEVDKLNKQINTRLDEIGEAEKSILAERQQIAAVKESIAIASFSSAWVIALIILGFTAKALRHEIIQRKQHEAALLIAKNQAENALKLLQQTQEELVQAEKMAALGGLVAGIAHEINTPIGISLSSATHLNAETLKVARLYQENELGGDELESYFDTAQQSCTLLTINSQRAADLINSFKQVAVDQSSGKQREFNLKNYIEEILLSLRPQLKKTAVTVELSCPEHLKVKGYPGAVSQVLTNFLLNSLIHAYEPNQKGVVSIQIQLLETDEVELIYSDDGKGIAQEVQSKIFEPFFTTRRGQGGSGLGLHIVYNLVRQTLKGHLQMSSLLGQGTTFRLRFARVL
jgi:signal transduction histidine kinase